MKIPNIAKNLINTGIFAAFLTIFMPALPCLSEEFKSEKDKFSLSYDNSLVPADIKLYNVALALKSKTANFPTFNVVIESGYIDLSASKSEKEKAVLDSYRLVGIKDVELVSSEDKIINGHPCFNVELSYSMDKQNMRSNIGIFSLFDRHYILTFIDQAERYNDSKVMAKSILDSFKLDGSPNIATPPETTANTTSILLAFLAFFTVAAFIIVKIMRR